MNSSCSIKSPLPRVGGKNLLKNSIIRHIPKHKVFVEVFAGSCIISLTKKPSETTIVNDIDSNLISFWKILQDKEKRKELISSLDNMLYSRTMWNEIRERWKLGIFPDNPINKIAEWFFLNRTCYASDIKHGGFIGYAEGRNMCKTFRNSINHLDEVGEIIKYWIIENLNHKDCISRFDSYSTVFYIDAPYYLPDSRNYYAGSFTLQDHKELAKILNNIKGRALVSHYECDTYNQLYQGWNKYTFESFKGSSKTDIGKGKPKTTEALYCNFKSEARTRNLFEGMSLE